MSDIFVNFTTQYDGSYYCIIHDPQIIFINKNTKKLEPVIEKFLDFVFLLEKKQMNTYLASVIADDLPSGVYTFRIYRKNGLVPDINKDDLVSVGQTGWNKELKIQQNSNDIIGSISAYADKQDGIQRVSILMDSLQLGLVNNESGSVILDHDESAGSIKIKASGIPVTALGGSGCQPGKEKSHGGLRRRKRQAMCGSQAQTKNSPRTSLTADPDWERRFFCGSEFLVRNPKGDTP